MHQMHKNYEIEKAYIISEGNIETKDQKILDANLHDHVPEEYTTKNHNRSPCLISRIFISCEIVFKTFRL